MVDTLVALRQELGDTPLCLILGSDAFQALTTWHRWQALTDFAHIAVMQRPGAPLVLPPALDAFAAARRVDNARVLHRRPAGSILVQPVTQLAISATQIRDLLARGQSVRYLLPEAVLGYIQYQELYRPSTAPATITPNR